MKKILSILLVLAMLATLAACGATGDVTVESDSDAVVDEVVDTVADEASADSDFKVGFIFLNYIVVL